MAKRKTPNLWFDQRAFLVWRKRTRDALLEHTMVFIVIGILMVTVSLTHRFFRYRALSSGQAVAAVYTQTNSRPPAPSHIFIQWFLDTPIEGRTFVDGAWSISDDKATYLLNSARPGEQGNIILYGHNTREILGNIRALKGGEKITITTEDGGVHLYRVVATNEVSPDNLSLLSPTQDETLTIYTCSGLLDSQRFVVTAKPIK